MSDIQSATSDPPSQPTTYPQFIRKVGLVVSGQSGNGLDLSEMRIKFHVEGLDRGHPKTAIIRVYNLAESTQNQIKKEFTQVLLQAGYRDGAFGVIFTGTIARIKTGRENATDTFLEIQAADGDRAHNFAFVNRTLAAGSTSLQKAQVAADAMKKSGGITSSDTAALQGVGGVFPRGQVLFGLAPAYLDDVAATTNTSWFIEDGVLKFVSDTGYLPGEAVVLNSQTGMISIPEATNNGIEVTALLNPNIKVGRRVQIDNASINQTQVDQIGVFPVYGDKTQFATVTNDGFYRALVVSHVGDSRGNDFYTRMTCLALDASAPPNASVQPYG